MDEPGFGHGSGSKPEPFPITSLWPPVDPGSNKTCPRRSGRHLRCAVAIGISQLGCESIGLPAACVISVPPVEDVFQHAASPPPPSPSSSFSSSSLRQPYPPTLSLLFQSSPVFFFFFFSVGVKLKETAFAPFSVLHFCSVSLLARARCSECTFHP